MNKGQIISFMGIKPAPGLYWTSNRHDCMGQAQITITIGPDGLFETVCPTCGDNPTVFYECGSFSFFAGSILL